MPPSSMPEGFAGGRNKQTDLPKTEERAWKLFSICVFASAGRGFHCSTSVELHTARLGPASETLLVSTLSKK